MRFGRSAAPRRSTSAFVITALCLVTTYPAVSGAKDASEEFAAHFQRIEATIAAGDFKSAKRKSAKFEREMLDRIIGGPRVPEYLGELAKLYAIALAGVGEMDHAAWKWHMAREFSPQITDADLAGFGEPGLGLEAHLAQELDRIHKKEEHGPTLIPPETTKEVVPRFPKPQSMLRLDCRVIVQVVIEKDGVPHFPTVIKSSGRPTLVYSTLDAFRKWRFKPARTETGPAASFYVLSVNFDS